ncbi:MAG: twin-arginine translocase TatA/TatE family subunit [Gemmatimonadales bacterium]
MFGNIGFTEMMVLLLVVLLVFGARRLPEIGQSLGKGIREFKRSISDAGESVNSALDDRGSSSPSRQIDSSAPPTSSEPKRLSQ